MRIIRKGRVDLSRIYKRLEPFILTADTILTANTIMSDFIKVNNMSRFPRRMTISRKQTGLIKASLRDYVNIVSSRRPQTSDPIQVLVDEYKAYVTSQGGVIGVSDSALYTEYQDMITKGEITNTGVNTKLVLNGGLWGYKMGALTKITHIYSLTKISGNYFTWDCTPTTVDLVAGKIKISRTPFFSLPYGLNSFYIEFKSMILTFVAFRSTMFVSLTGSNVRLSDNVGRRIYRLAPIPDVFSGANFFNLTASNYKFNYNRSNVLGTEKLDLVCDRDGTAAVHTFAQADWAFNMDADTFRLGEFAGDATNELSSFKIALK